MKPQRREGKEGSPGSQAPMPAHPGTAGPSRARGGLGVHTLGALQLRGGAPGGQTQPYLSWRSPDGQLGGGGGSGVANFPGSPFTRPALGMGGGRVGVGRPGPARPVGPGAPAVCGARHMEKAGSSGAGTAVGGGMPRYLKTHKYRSSTGGRRRARGQVASTRVSRGPRGRPPAPAPGFWADGRARLCPGRSSGCWRPNWSGRGRAGEMGDGCACAELGETGGDGAGDRGHTGGLECWGGGRGEGTATGRREFWEI